MRKINRVELQGARTIDPSSTTRQIDTWIERLLGGATHHLLAQAPVALMMAH